LCIKFVNGVESLQVTDDGTVMVAVTTSGVDVVGVVINSVGRDVFVRTAL